MNTMETVRRFFDKAPQFMHLGQGHGGIRRATTSTSRWTPANFLAFVEREAGDLDEESMLEYCRMHLEFAGLWNLGLELEVRSLLAHGQRAGPLARALDAEPAANRPRAGADDVLQAGPDPRADRLARAVACTASPTPVLFRHADTTNPTGCHGPRAARCARRTRTSTRPWPGPADPGGVNELRLARGDQPMGFKIGFTNRSLWPLYGVFQPIWAPVWDRTVYQSDAGPSVQIADIDLNAIGKPLSDVHPAAPGAGDRARPAPRARQQLAGGRGRCGRLGGARLRDRAEPVSRLELHGGRIVCGSEPARRAADRPPAQGPDPRPIGGVPVRGRA